MLNRGKVKEYKMNQEEKELNVPFLLNSLFNTLPNLVALIDIDGTILTINNLAALQLGKKTLNL